MSAYLIASKANRFIGKLEEALKASEQANKIAKELENLTAKLWLCMRLD
jgi:ATP/maltotriose-dependent transcriptional regulator MalT